MGSRQARPTKDAARPTKDAARPTKDAEPEGATRDRLIAAAYALFDEQGYDRTTVDDIAARAGVGRATFFRTFGSKEDVIFPDHDVLLQRIRTRLATATPDTGPVAVTEAAAVVLDHYLAEGARARARYALTRTVPALRGRELAGMQRYRQVFGEFLAPWLGSTVSPGDTMGAQLRAELLADAVVTAHNHVLRGWLRGTITEPGPELRRALGEVLRMHLPAAAGAHDQAAPAVVVVVEPGRTLADVLPAIRAAAGDPT